ncbi:hypothetical protein DEO72_LG3g2420 [Vigna unguiculata]|uniref:Uncharacterized protein n=1 Tax=Vigna unguiculata TaxID=3917 RepID=A0A4D6LH93_VIGUN|nr:hypothetical protein DEO72_LG3g2420 [Vigna unguiculata]
MLTNLKPPGGTEIHHQALLPETPQYTFKWTSRLAAKYSPPGGFLKNSRIQQNHDTNAEHA